MYNLIHDIVLKTHREEKVARANTAAIIVEQLADQSPPHELGEASSTATSSPTTPKKRKIIHTPGAIYDDGNIYIVGNPLETMKEVRCPKCGLPRLLHPAIGGRQTPDPTIEYCKRRPFVDKPNHDIYGQPFKQVGPVKNTRKSKGKGFLAAENQAEAGSSFESPAPSPPEAETKKKVPRNVAPDVECQRCGHSVRVSHFSNHLAKCMGIGGRASGRAAALKINGQATGSQGGSTPPISRRSTPLPLDKTSPQKRDVEELEDDEDDWADDSPKKKKAKKVVTKKWKSGKITVNGKAVIKEPPGEIKDSGQAAAVKEEKKHEGVVGLDPREVSESSQTLSSP
jgi:DNA-directed RNA polymerase subunit RPC12/RpoP